MSGKVLREPTEWSDIWIESAQKNDRRRILLVGDSIARSYYDGVKTLLGEDAYLARFAVSTAVSNPLFAKHLELATDGYEFEVIHFNSGLHGWGYTEDEYIKSFREVIDALKKQHPEAKLILALTTPVNPESDRADLKERVRARNDLVLALGLEYNVRVSNLYEAVDSHPEYYTDMHHFNEQGKKVLAECVAGNIKKELGL